MIANCYSIVCPRHASHTKKSTPSSSYLDLVFSNYIISRYMQYSQVDQHFDLPMVFLQAHKLNTQKFGLIHVPLQTILQGLTCKFAIKMLEHGRVNFWRYLPKFNKQGRFHNASVVNGNGLLYFFNGTLAMLQDITRIYNIFSYSPHKKKFSYVNCFQGDKLAKYMEQTDL